MAAAGHSRSTSFLHVEVPQPSKRAKSFGHAPPREEYWHSILLDADIADTAAKAKAQALHDNTLLYYNHGSLLQDGRTSRAGSSTSITSATRRPARTTPSSSEEIQTLDEVIEKHKGLSEQSNGHSVLANVPKTLAEIPDDTYAGDIDADDDSDSVVLMPTKSKSYRAKGKARAISDDESVQTDNTRAGLPSINGHGHVAASVPSKTSGRTSGQFPDSPDCTSLGVDGEILKILGRRRFGTEYVYAVKIHDGRIVFVTEGALDTYQDLLDDYTQLVEDGWRDDDLIHSDSDEEPMARARRNGSMGNDDGDDAYEEQAMASGSPEPQYISSASDSNDEKEPSDFGSDASRSSHPRKHPQQGSRKSMREGARKKIDYSKQAEYHEEDEEEEEEEDFSEGSSGASSVEVPLSRNLRQARLDSDSSSDINRGSRTRRVRRVEADDTSDASVHVSSRRNGASDITGNSLTSSRKQGKQRSHEGAGAGSTDDNEDDSDDVRAEQLHRDTCSHCKASSAKVLLPEFIKKEKRRRKKQNLDVDDWNAENIKEYGCWIHCEVCSSSWHWNCLPGSSMASGMKIIYKKLLASQYGAEGDNKPHLNIKKTLKIPSCPDCLKPHGTRCMFCSKEEYTVDITVTNQKAVDDAPSSRISAVDTGDNVNVNTHLEKVEGMSTAMPVDSADNQEATGGNQTITTQQKDLLFRCTKCRRAAHYSCIPTPNAVDKWQYSWDWHCSDCMTWGAIDAVLAWRPIDFDKKATDHRHTTPPPSPSRRLVPDSPGKRAMILTDLPDHKASWWNAEYLVKFKDKSFRQAQWVPHAWLSAAYKQRLRNFICDGPLIDITPENSTRDGEDDVADDHLEEFNLQPTPDAIDRIPKDWLTPDRVLDVFLRPKSGKGRDDARVINMKGRMSDDPHESTERISRMYIKWQGLPYESATWEEGFPSPNDPQYDSFVKAYGDYLRHRHVEIPRPSAKELQLLDRSRPGSQFRELTQQPDYITLGKLMDFQLLGVSWLYYNWWIKKGCILADEMGLGKTVQIISFLSILFKTENCKPFLVVVPNSTLQNWQREFAKWAPLDLRVVPYYGTKMSRRVIDEYELFTAGVVAEQKLRCHVVLTTYECLVSEAAVFRRIPRWEALVIDEAQRLKSGPKNLLWRHLKTLNIGHSVLLTGTPVNNNLDELFNLLHFLDPHKFDDLQYLHKRYETLTPELVEEVQNLAQPYFLRRTKEAVLNLPPLSEVIIPLSMSPLQKVVYKSVLEKNMDALKVIYDKSKAKSKQKFGKVKVTNVLMELRKTLCHPYLVREELEHDTNLDAVTIHKNLVEASSKLVFLADFLPKLEQRGHRVLLFSQFVIVLNVIERFLQGMNVKFVRLDGSTSQAQRQKNIDAFNEPTSQLTIFILTTRAGGVGINLATADTVILFDADFNPFQDLQAISRAHRIGQTRKVMCFKLMVKGTCEEKIIETGKKKMILEQLIVDSGDLKNDDDEEGVNNVESLLLFGAQALFNEVPEEASKNEITYSPRELEELIEKTENEESSAEAIEEKKRKTLEANKAFSYARVWERQQHAKEEEADKAAVESQRGFWTRIIEAKDKERADEELLRALQTGRGYRKRKQMNYKMSNNLDLFSEGSASTAKTPPRSITWDAEDEEYMGQGSESDGSDGDVPDVDGEDLAGIDQSLSKKQKLADGRPVRPAIAPYVNPMPMNIAPLQPPHPRYDLVRSPTPPDMRDTRIAIVKNLLKRAQALNDTSILQVIQSAMEAPSSLEQVILFQKATAMLKTSTGQPGGAPSHSTEIAARIDGEIDTSMKP